MQKYPGNLLFLLRHQIHGFADEIPAVHENIVGEEYSHDKLGEEDRQVGVDPPLVPRVGEAERLLKGDDERVLRELGEACEIEVSAAVAVALTEQALTGECPIK